MIQFCQTNDLLIRNTFWEQPIPHSYTYIAEVTEIKTIKEAELRTDHRLVKAEMKLRWDNQEEKPAYTKLANEYHSEIFKEIQELEETREEEIIGEDEDIKEEEIEKAVHKNKNQNEKHEKILEEEIRELKMEQREVESEQKEIKDEIGKIRRENQNIKKESAELKNEIRTMNEKIDILDRGKRRNNVDAICLLETADASEKEKAMKNKRKLRNNRDNRIFINDDISKEERIIQGKIRRMAQQEKQKASAISILIILN
ncbi:hypothetical protein ILUMI_02571 [Ignelater luminosus]|uniref:Uncharacterized protein n=1 Tax=Ignelater luminosus TaxID=2038154 RepID=A0A8K0DHE5_IGNLU|nr:hypothetical protein ILUMI_02571 [Ignelater luminosus]